MQITQASAARTSVVALLALSVFATAACATEPPSVVISSAFISSACQAYEAARVSRGERCRNDELFRLSAPFTSEFGLRCTALTQAPGSAWTEATLQACAKGLAVGCGDHVEGCLELFRGTLPGGAPCSASAQCLSGYCALGDTDASCGTCAPALALGSECNPLLPASGCPLGSSCGEWSSTSGPPTCQARGEGEPCLNGGCATGLFCSDGICLARREQGEACDPEDTTTLCANALACVGGVCGVRRTEGETCTHSAECDVRLGYCVNGRCQAARTAELGELCDDTIGCAMNAVCFSGRCSPRRMLGESCNGTGECVHFTTCVDGRCRTLDASVCK